MVSFKQIMVFLAFLLFMQGALSESITTSPSSSLLQSQYSLASFGFSLIENDAPLSKKCMDVTISLPVEVKEIKGAGILSIQAAFTGLQTDNSYVSISINDAPAQIIWPERFSCQTLCWARVFVPEIKNGSAKATICAVLSTETKKISISSDSFVGIYDTPVLSITNSSPNLIYLGDRAKMRITIANTGTKAADIYAQFIHPDTRANVQITSLDIVEGDSSATTTINPNETKEFIYYIKPTIVSGYNLPAAALFFTNYFGEKQVMISNHPQMSVEKPKQIELSLVTIDNTQPFTFKAIIKNNLPVAFTGTIIMSPQTALQSPAQQLFVAPNSEKEVIFTAAELSEGKYSFFATVRDTNTTGAIYSSNSIDLEVKQSGVSTEIIFAIIGIMIAVAIFSWIYLKK
jgi:hypothetical protein